LLKCFFEHKLGLGHGPFCGADDQAYSVDHVHNSFYFSSEILMAGRVDDVDVVVVIKDAGGLGSS
jgi:hypothetical protein